MNQANRLLSSAARTICTNCSKVHFQAKINSKTLISITNIIQKNFSNLSCMENHKCKMITDIDGTEDKDISYVLQKMHVNKVIDDYTYSLKINPNHDFSEISKRENAAQMNKYKELRIWKNSEKENSHMSSEDLFIFKLISFNILAQELLKTHQHLYKDHNKDALTWEIRKSLLVQEILDSGAHMICLQEMQEEHLRDFLIPFQENGFLHLYKRRTNNKTDGVLVMYKQDMFHLLEFSKLELYQTGVELLNRDNVGLIMKFCLKDNPETKFVIATTHLLFNPKRNDIRLCQVQLLFAEIERISYIENTLGEPQYLPIILAGDFNLEPHSGVYRFITEGSIEFVGKGKNLEKCEYRCLSNSLIPPHLYVTDECQHFNVLLQRLCGKGSGQVMLESTENKVTLYSNQNASNAEVESLVNSKTNTYQKIEITGGHYVTFCSGLLTHPFQFQSVYNHTDKRGKSEATTFQNRWITVDYIFYSSFKQLERYTLPTTEECQLHLSTIPNLIIGSDHLCLGATFQLKKR